MRPVWPSARGAALLPRRTPAMPNKTPAAPRFPLLPALAVFGFVLLFVDRVANQSRFLAAPCPTVAPAPAAPAPAAPAPAAPVSAAPASAAGRDSFDTSSSAFVPHYSRADKPMPACAKGRAKTFLVVFLSRSGSTAICGELKRHPQVHMELLEYLDKLGVARENVTGSVAETRAFFRRGIEKGLTPGFKIRAHHILSDPEPWRKLVREFDTRIIWQYRKNIVKSSIGTYAFEFLGDDTAISGIKKKDATGDRCSMGVGCKFKIENMDFFHHLLKSRVLNENKITKAVGVLGDGRDCVLEVPYEDYLYHAEDTMRDVQEFLGLDWQRTEADRIKATKDSLCEVVENFDELCRNFYGCTVWQPFFEDFVNNCRCAKYSHSDGKYCAVV